VAGLKQKPLPRVAQGSCAFPKVGCLLATPDEAQGGATKLKARLMPRACHALIIISLSFTLCED